MKTAMQKHIEWLEEKLKEQFRRRASEISILDTEESIKNAQLLLDEEKSQIVDAWNDGACGGGQFSISYYSPHEYYNETYGGEQ